MQRRLENLEDRHSYWRGALQGIDFSGESSTAREQLKWTESEIKRAEDRLRELLDSDEDVTDGHG